MQQLVIVIYGFKRPVKRSEGPREVLENVSVAVTLQWQAPRIMTTSAFLSIKNSYMGASVLSAASVGNRRRVESTALHWLADPVVKQNLQRFADKSGCTRSQTAYGQGLVETDTGTLFSRGGGLGHSGSRAWPQGVGHLALQTACCKAWKTLVKTGHSGALGGGGHRAFLSLSLASKGPRGWGIWGGLVKKVGVLLSTNPCPILHIALPTVLL